MNKGKRSFSFLLAFLLLLSASSLTVFADPDIGGGAGMGDPMIGSGVILGNPGAQNTGTDPGTLPNPAPLLPGPVPAGVFDGIRMVLKNITAGDLYSLDGVIWLPSVGSEVPIPGVTAGSIILVKTPASPVNSESPVQSIQILKPSAPVGVTAADPSSMGGTGMIMGVNSGMEYCGPDNLWKAAPDRNIEGLSPGAYLVRGKGGDNILPGDPLSLTINAYTPVKEQKPQAVFNAADMTLSGIPAARAQYSLDGGATWIGASGTAVLAGVTAGSGIQVIVRGDGVSTEDSDVQSIAVSKPGAPSVEAVNSDRAGGFGEIRNVDAGMEYRQAGGSWQQVSGGSVTGLSPGQYEVRYRGAGTALPGEIADVTINEYVPTRHDKPAAVFEASTMLLSGVPEGGMYSLNGGNSWTAASGSVQLSGVTAERGIQVKKAGDGAQKLDSEIQTIAVTRPGPPAAAAMHVPSIGGTGGLQNVNAGMQFCVSGSANWQNIGGNQVTGLSPGSYDVRYRAAGTALAGDIQTVLVNGFSGKKAETPQTVFDAASMRLSGLKNGMQYSVDGGASWIPAGDGYAVLSGVSAGAGIRVKIPGDGRTTVDSDVQVIALTQAQPPAVQAAQPDKIGGKGKLVNVNNAMQYRKEGVGEWIDIGSDTVHDLETGKYEVRVKASGNVLASVSTVVEIGSVQGKKEDKPDASYNAQNRILSGMREGMRYSTDGGSNYEKAEKNGDIDLSNRNVTYKNDIRVYMPGNGVNTVDSDIQVIDVKQQAAPSGVKAVSAAAASKTGSLAGVNSSMEYKLESDKDWTPVTGDTVSGLKPGIYQVRTAGKYNYVASEPITVKIELSAAAPAAANTPAQNPAPAPAPAAKPEKDKDSAKQEAGNQETGKAQEKDGEDKKAEGQEGEKGQKPVSGDPGTPVLSGEKQAAGWEDIDKQIAAAKASDMFTVDMNGSTKLPAGTINSLKGSGSKLILDMGDGICWAVAGESVDSTAFEPVDLKVARGDGIIPKELMQAAEKETGSLSATQFEIAHSGPLGFDGVLAMNLGADYIKKTANLFYYNEDSSQLELQNSGVVDEGGNISFVFDHASKYALLVSDQAFTEKIIIASGADGGRQVGQNEPKPSAQADINEDQKPHKSKAALIAVIVVITLLGAGAIFFVANRNKFLDN